MVDDGPRRPIPWPRRGPGLPGGPSPATRILFPSLPNAVDAKGIGRFTSDVWLTNTDVGEVRRRHELMSPVLDRTTGPAPAYDTAQSGAST